ncbi:MAG: acyltransferase family protein [Acidimicrobiales bacterium]
MNDEVSDVSHQRVPYLPGLDGVRAFAVLAVMIYHGGLSLAPGGFLGVDTFFVLSGFLITSLLVSEWQGTSTIRLGAFWARRARRLLPALFLMMLFVAFYASVIVPRGTYPGLRLDALSTLLYVSNWHFLLSGTNYFAQTGLPSPLLHTWSLAVEEQFYFVWPLVILGLLRLTRSLRVLLAVSVAAAVTSAVLMYLLYTPASTNLVYFSTDTRSQCIFIGAALSLGLLLFARRAHASGAAPGAMWRPGGGRGRSACAVIGVVGAAVTLAIWVWTDSVSSFPFTGGIFVVGLGTAGVILSVVGAPTSPVPRFLSLAPLRYIGQISYGLYIWHWPLFIWVDEARTGLSGYALFAVRLAVTFAVAVASYHLVERPIRRRTFLKNWRARVAVPVAVGLVLVATVVATTVPVAATASVLGKGPASAPAQGPPVHVLLIGDSTALTLGLGLGEPAVQSKYGYVLDDQGILGCGVVVGPEIELLGQPADSAMPCNGATPAPGTPLAQQPFAVQWKAEMAATHPNVVVLLAGRWEDVNRVYQGKWTNILNPTFARYVKQQLEAASNLVTATGANMVFLTAPCTDEGEQLDGAPWPEDSPARLAEYNRLVRQVAAEHPTTDSVVDLDATVCPNGTFTPTYKGVTIRRPDGVHFTTPAGPVLAPVLMPPILASGRAQMARVAASRAG